jgi:hypothetical protein
MGVTILLQPQKHERQWRFNIFGSCMLGNQMAIQHNYSNITILAAYMSKSARENIATSSSDWALMVHRWLLVMHVEYSTAYAMALSNNRTIDHLHGQICWWQYRNRRLNISANGESTVLVGVEWAVSQRTALGGSLREWLTVSLLCMSLYWT